MKSSDSRIVDVTQAVLAAYGTLTPQTSEERDGNAQLIAHLTDWFNSEDRLISAPATYLATRFADAELDFVTEGNRGMGRMSEYWPRFGGKHRKLLKGSTDSARRELHRLFSRQIFCGYLFTEYLVEAFSGCEMARDPGSNDQEKFLYQWVPLIFSDAGAETFDAEMVGRAAEQYYNVKGLWGHATGDDIHKVFIQMRIPIEELEKYLIKVFFDAGICLRLVEGQNLTETESLSIATGGGYSAFAKSKT